MVRRALRRRHLKSRQQIRDWRSEINPPPQRTWRFSCERKLLSSTAVWNRADDRECKDDEATGKRSLFCALHKACIDVLGSYDHRRVALQEVRFAVEDATRGREFEHRLRDFNNLPETRLEDIRKVLTVAKGRVSARLTAKKSG